MKGNLDRLPTKTWLLLVLPLIVIGYSVARVVVPEVIHAVVPEVVRNVLHFI
jgi:hypothetical protein